MKHEENENQSKRTREEQAAEFERLLRKCSPEQLKQIEQKMLEMMTPEQRAAAEAEWKAREEERRQEEADLRELGAKLSGFSIGRLAIAPAPKWKGGEE